MEGIEALIKDVPSVPKPGDLYTLGTFDRSLNFLLSIPSSEGLSKEEALRQFLSHRPEPEPSQEVLRQACEDVRQAYGKRCFLRIPERTIATTHIPERTIEGTFQASGWLGVHFVHYEGKSPSACLYSPEWLKLENINPYTFSTERHEGSNPLWGWDGLKARYALWRAGVKPK